MEIRLLNVGRVVAGTWWRFRDVQSPFSRLYFVHAGRARVWHHGTEHVLHPGDSHLVPCFSRASYECRDRFELTYIHFTSRTSPGIDLLEGCRCSYTVAAGAGERKLFRRLVELVPDGALADVNPYVPEPRALPGAGPDLLQQLSPAKRLEGDGIMRLLLALFVDNRTPAAPDAASRAGRFAPVIEHMERSLHLPLAIADLAKVARLNPAYFSDAFAKTVGIRPVAFLNRLRIVRARELLLGSLHMSIEEISGTCGFRHPAFFVRTFRRLCGCTPGGYRRAGGWL